jgi:dTDP-4-dehydrorhamnose reductase
MKILIIGGGYIGTRCAEEWKDEAVLVKQKIYEAVDVVALLEKYQPDVVLNAAGVRGRPNVDWCETHQLETIIGNTKLPIMIAEACQQKNIYLLHIGSGCIFYGESPDKKGWKEDDFANPTAVYSKAKYAADLVLATIPSVGIARIRMPIDSIPFSGNLIDKLASFEKVIDVENSVTIIADMIKVFYELLTKKSLGYFSCY